MVFKMPEQAEGLEVAITKTAHLLLVGLTIMGKSLVYMLPFSSVLYDLITWWQLSSFPSFCCIQTFNMPATQHSKLSMVPTTFWTSEDINNVCLPWAYQEIPWVYPIPSSQQQTCKVCHQQTPFYSSTCRLLLLLHKLEATYHCGQVFFFQPLNRFCTKFQKQRFLSCYWWQLVHCLSPPHCLNPLYCQVKDSTEKIGKLIRCKYLPARERGMNQTQKTSLGKRLWGIGFCRNQHADRLCIPQWPGDHLHPPSECQPLIFAEGRWGSLTQSALSNFPTCISNRHSQGWTSIPNSPIFGPIYEKNVPTTGDTRVSVIDSRNPSSNIPLGLRGLANLILALIFCQECLISWAKWTSQQKHPPVVQVQTLAMFTSGTRVKM